MQKVINFSKKEVITIEEKKEPAINIQAKLNPKLDADIIEEIKKIDKRDRSRLYREAVRFYFKHLKKLNEPE